MLNGNQKKVIKITIICFVVALLISYFFAGYIQTLIYTYSFSLNPATIIKTSIEHGFPTLMFLLFFLPLTAIIALVVYRYVKALGNVDELGRRFEYPDNMCYGDAHFLKPWEYKEKARVGPVEVVTGPILGQLVTSNHGEQCIAKKPGNPNDNILIVAPSGSGKSATFARNAAYQTIRQRQSIVITDPKGELHADLAGLFTTHGYIVRTLNLIDFDASNTWNCLSAINDNKLVETVSIIVDTMVKNFKGDGERVKNDIYTNGEKLLLQAFILRVYLGTDYSWEEKNIRSVHMLAMDENLEQKMNDKSCASNDREYNLWFSPWQKIKAGATGNLWGNILTNLLADLGVLGDDKVCTLLSDNDIDMSLPGQQPCAYFLIIPAHHETYRFISALFFTSFFQTLIDDATHLPGITLPVCVNFLLDEFANIGIIPGWPGTISVTRSYNINAWMIVQTIGQLETNYADSWETIMSNCAVHLILGANEETTCKYFSDMIGNTTILASTEQHKQNEFFFPRTKKKSTREAPRALLEPAELRTLPQYHSIILLAGKTAICAKTVYHELHPLSKERCEDPLGPMPPLADTRGREERKALEAEIIDNYYVKHKDDKVMTDEELDEYLDSLTPTNIFKAKIRGTIAEARGKITDKIHGNYEDDDIEDLEYEDIEDAEDIEDIPFMELEFEDEDGPETEFEQRRRTDTLVGEKARQEAKNETREVVPEQIKEAELQVTKPVKKPETQKKPEQKTPTVIKQTPPPAKLPATPSTQTKQSSPTQTRPAAKPQPRPQQKQNTSNNGEMTLKEAWKVVVPGNGRFGGMPLAMVAKTSGPQAIEWFAEKYDGKNEHLRTAAKVIYKHMEQNGKKKRSASNGSKGNRAAGENVPPMSGFTHRVAAQSYPYIEITCVLPLPAASLALISPDREKVISDEPTTGLP